MKRDSAYDLLLVAVHYNSDMADETSKALEEMAEPPGQMIEPHDTGYQFVADKVGFVPNLRRSDNLFQAKFVGITAVLTAIAFLFAPWWGQNDPWFLRIGLGFVAGLLGGLLLSGFILAILNLVRKS